MAANYNIGALSSFPDQNGRLNSMPPDALHHVLQPRSGIERKVLLVVGKTTQLGQWKITERSTLHRRGEIIAIEKALVGALLRRAICHRCLRFTSLPLPECVLHFISGHRIAPLVRRRSKPLQRGCSARMQRYWPLQWDVLQHGLRNQWGRKIR